jgi:phenylacetate-coenzyme A ligase PaaK-like adenylate-forming protein
MKSSELIHEILAIKSESAFETLALRLFQYQYEHNIIYNNYLKAIKIAPDQIKNISQIPFLPIEFFKTHEVVTNTYKPEIVFTSSGTTGMSTSRHMVKDTSVYENTFLEGFRKAYGPLENYCILALLPSYLEREGSSLVYMAEKMISMTKANGSGFFLHNHTELHDKILENEKRGQKTLLLGVTYALLDFAEAYPIALKHTTIMETGGMKGRREEITREEVHAALQNAFDQTSIHSEYGMTELMSQAYSAGKGLYQSPPWMKVLVRDPSDPLSADIKGRGGINIIDLANIDSCCFLATQDLGVAYGNGQFEILGRMDHSDVRGCSLMIS